MELVLMWKIRFKKQIAECHQDQALQDGFRQQAKQSAKPGNRLEDLLKNKQGSSLCFCNYVNPQAF